VQVEKLIRSTNLCDRLLRSFRAVEPTALFACPISIKPNTSDVDLTRWKLAPGTTSPFGWEVLQIQVFFMSRKILFRCKNLIKTIHMSMIDNCNAKKAITIVQKGYLLCSVSFDKRSRTCLLYISTICTPTSYEKAFLLLSEMSNKSFKAR
jgi:hypothetical protein